MHILALLLSGFVCVFHLYAFVLESFLWTAPIGLKTFRNDPAKAEATKVLAFNQGFYNALLAAGVIWGLASGPEQLPRTSFFLGCVVVAGAVGGWSVNKRIFLVQGLPALLALGAFWLGR